MKRFARFLANVVAIIVLTVLAIKLFPIPWLTHAQTSWLVDASEFFHFDDAEWFGTVTFGLLYLLFGCLAWLIIRKIYSRLVR
ncbi:hypothetical protein Z042_10755 [Chania multitudinisentens RB-25]|uniref:Uncharacterized protein n=1 Tax=Chania multitudinisentens RB-25 TaxID=1441930 RepID=W0LK90_9GAMM|nr:hypothetical protein Z042_10755 [Chania multitudinisentens RB-25]